MNQEKPFYKSKKFWSMASATAIAVYGIKYGLTPEQILVILSPILAYEIGQGLADLGKNASQKQKPAMTEPPILPEPTQNIPQPEIVPEIKSEAKPVSEKKTYWEMTTKEAEAEYLGYFEAKVKEAQEHWEWVNLTFPEYVSDLRQHAKDILEAHQHSLKIARAMVTSIKTGRIAPDSIGPVGYKIASVPEDKIPEWIKSWLRSNP